MDIDYIFGTEAIEELQALFDNQEHGEREKITDDILKFVKRMKKKYKVNDESET